MIKKFDSYINSGLDWVGDIPIEWSQTQLKYISSISKGRKAKEDYQDLKDGMIPYLSMEYLRNQTDSPSYVYADDASIVLVDEKDLLILWDGSKAGEIVKAKNGALSSTMGKIHLESQLFDLNFLTYYLKNAELYIQANTVGMGIPHVSGEVLRTLFITFPKIQEQTKIAQYLDHHTTIIDELIQRKEKLIELLKEKRQAVINEAVTKGLNPNAKMKDSGIDWLGEIPAHWRVSRLKHISSVISKGTTPSTEGKGLVDEGIRYLKAENIKDLEVSSSPEFFIDEETHEILKRSQLQENDILFVIAGATIGKVAILQKELTPANTNQAVSFIRLKENENHKFVHYWLMSSKIYDQIWLKAVQSAQPNLSMENLGNFPLPYPAQDEKKEIVNFLNSKIGEYEHLIIDNLKLIEKLKEYRQSIISEAVTGKIDVRDWQPNKQQVA